VTEWHRLESDETGQEEIGLRTQLAGGLYVCWPHGLVASTVGLDRRQFPQDEASRGINGNIVSPVAMPSILRGRRQELNHAVGNR
jgi:hypothetical protein